MKTKNVKVLLSVTIVLLMAWAFAACSKKKDATPTVDKASLIAAVATANTLVSTTHEGVAAGDYLKGSQAPFMVVISQAQGVIDDATATQAEVVAALSNLAAATATYQSNLVTAIDPSNLVGQWTFDEVGAAIAGATVKDYSGGNHDGELKAGDAHWAGSGVATLVADRYGNAGKALHFDKGQNVEVPYSTALNPGIISISLWEKQDVESSIYANQYMVSMNRWNCYKFQIQDTPRAFFTAHAVRSAGDTTYYDKDQHDGTVPQGVWHHIVVTFGGGHEVFYIDGDLIYDWGASTTADEHVPGTIVPISAHPVNLVFGQDLPTGGYDADFGGYFHGALDEIRIYKSVLTASQVTSIYNLEKP